jgi:hypothetical protein
VAAGTGGGGARLALLIAAFVLVVAAIAWLFWVANHPAPAVPQVDVKVPAPDVLPDRTPAMPATPPPPLPTPSGRAATT